jgi:hypothetical protein
MAGCKSCKKKKPITELPLIVDETFYSPSRDEIKSALAELSSMKGVKPEKREEINKVFKFLFNQDFNFDCGGCASNQAQLFHNFVVNELKIEI